MVGMTIPENDIAQQIVDAAFQVHSALGPGLLESVYEVVLAHELAKRGRTVERQVAVPLKYDNLHFDLGFRADLIVDNRVLVELKCAERLAFAHKKQVLTYLKGANLRLGLLVNFGALRLKDGVSRIANGLPG